MPGIMSQPERQQSNHSPSNLSEDELAASSNVDFPLERTSKRRRLNSLTAAHSASESISSHPSSDPSSTTPIEPSRQGTQGSKDYESPLEKSKSKYRIRPYRIEPFCWQKPANSEQLKGASSCLQNQDRILTELNSPNIVTGTALKEVMPNVPELVSGENYDDILADIPSDAFSSPDRPNMGDPTYPIDVSSQHDVSPSRQSAIQSPLRVRAPQGNLRQTTLFGTSSLEATPQSQSTRRHNWPLANREEPLTHHELDYETLKTWVYPTNLGNIRDYQYNIVAKGLYHNLLVALPTGLGKTFIAATVMLNWFRWTRKAQIIFVAPTRPLVSQQVTACFEIAGIPRAATTMLTGNTPPGIRADEWLKKRVFFMTPQTLINDLKSGMCDPKNVVLLVVDEAHRATGNYAYVEVVRFIQRFNTSFRVLALTATPGASIETVQEVIDGLIISRIEIRTEESLDIRQYVHSRKIDTVPFDNSDEMVMLMGLFSRSLQPILDKLSGLNAYWSKDPMTLTPYGCSQARGTWMQSDAGRKASFGLKGMVNTIFSLLASLSHGTELLKYHGIGPFFQKMLSFRDEVKASGDKGSKYKKQIVDSEPFQKMMARIQSWVNNPDFVGHPKLEYLQNRVMNHFLDAGDGRGETDPSRTRIMVFVHFRDSAEEIVRVLKRSEPIVRPHVFVGQANSKNSDGMDQATQLAVIKQFQDGIYNTLVATSVGEEGLDIGQVDLIVCYDASASPIRMLQRMGRTGRKRAGNIVVTLMKGKEETNFVKAKDNYEKMQVEIAAGTKFAFHDGISRRIVPRTIQPIVDKKVIDIPPENTQPELPEPTKRAKAPKRPAKKFNMPDNVRTGFVKASRIDGTSSSGAEIANNERPRTRLKVSPEPISSLQEVLLSDAEKKALERGYLDVKGDTDQIVVVPSLNAFPNLQRSFRPTQSIVHGRLTRRVVNMLGKMHDPTCVDAGHYERHLQPKDRAAGLTQAEKRRAFIRDAPSIRSQRPNIDSDSGEQFETDQGAAHKTLSTFGDKEGDSTSDEETDVNDDDAHRPASSLPHSSLADSRRPFYVSPKKSWDSAPESGDELPEFSALAGSIQTTSTALVGDIQPRDARRSHGQRARRKVIEDDSDE